MRSKRWNSAKIYRKKRKQLAVLFLATAALLFLPFYAGSLAGYVYAAVIKSYIATAEGDFYFTSDLLTDGATVPAYHLTHDWTTAAVIGFELRNYENPLQISDTEITFTAAASTGDNVSGSIPPSEPAGQSQTVSLTVPAPADPGAPLEVLVTAASTAPYAKTLQGRFIISPAISYDLADNAGSPVAAFRLTLSPSDQPTRALTIAWPEGAAPDQTNPIILEAAGIDLTNRTLTASLNTAATYELVFFKDSPDVNYTGVTATGAEL